MKNEIFNFQTLIQSAFDGYNVCICAYGQTGSGKTHTIIGGDADPGLAPRTFHRIFELANEYSTQFHVHVSIYMLELYNDKLIDLLRQGAEVFSIFVTARSKIVQKWTRCSIQEKLDIKKDKRGIVWVQGSRVCAVENAAQLNDLFCQGLNLRHSSATRMNDRSSRSHLIVGISIECVSRLHGTVVHGKVRHPSNVPRNLQIKLDELQVTLLDLAGSERFTKSGASSEQLREASNINKSLSTLGDVISALANGQSFIPYRNSKLTMLMQDSLGGNAKTLLFVTASSAAHNLEETLTSLTSVTARFRINLDINPLTHLVQVRLQSKVSDQRRSPQRRK